MKENCPSDTALRVALRRAAHQILDDPKVFEDPLALRILGPENAPELQSNPERPEDSRFQRMLRAFLVARSRYAEDELHLAVRRGVRQYVVLGAGLDTFTFRNPYPAEVLHVVEVDHPATQEWKRSRIEEAGIPIPESLTFIPIDFETHTLNDGLLRGGFDTGKATFFSWLGVTPYLTSSAITATLQFVASMPMGSGIVFDYMISPSLLDPIARRVFDGLANHVASGGEPFQTFFSPSALKSSLLAMGFRQTENIEPEEMNSRYFQGRTDGLLVGTLAHIMNAQV